MDFSMNLCLRVTVFGDTSLNWGFWDARKEQSSEDSLTSNTVNLCDKSFLRVCIGSLSGPFSSKQILIFAQPGEA